MENFEKSKNTREACFPKASQQDDLSRLPGAKRTDKATRIVEQAFITSRNGKPRALSDPRLKETRSGRRAAHFAGSDGDHSLIGEVFS
jgi:hypothetical protein